jgi:DNA-binding cell septation regulator SpoVG
MPRNKPRGGKYYDVAFPIKAKTPKIIEEAIMAEYKKPPARIENDALNISRS